MLLSWQSIFDHIQLKLVELDVVQRVNLMEDLFCLWDGRPQIVRIWVFSIVITSLSINNFFSVLTYNNVLLFTKSWSFCCSPSGLCCNFLKKYGRLLTNCPCKRLRYTRKHNIWISCITGYQNGNRRWKISERITPGAKGFSTEDLHLRIVDSDESWKIFFLFIITY